VSRIGSALAFVLVAWVLMLRFAPAAWSPNVQAQSPPGVPANATSAVRTLSLPATPYQYAIVDLPRTHQIYHTMFDLEGVPQIPAAGIWLGSGQTSERGADSAQVHARGISDANGRVMVFMTHNTDVSDSWEREGEDPGYFYKFSIDGYRVAVNVLVYAMTH